MISYIRGPLEEKREDSVVVEAGNIGYRIFIPSSVLGAVANTHLPQLARVLVEVMVEKLTEKKKQPTSNQV